MTACGMRTLHFFVLCFCPTLAPFNTSRSLLKFSKSRACSCSLLLRLTASHSCDIYASCTRTLHWLLRAAAKTVPLRAAPPLNATLALAPGIRLALALALYVVTSDAMFGVLHAHTAASFNGATDTTMLLRAARSLLCVFVRVRPRSNASYAFASARLCFARSVLCATCAHCTLYGAAMHCPSAQPFVTHRAGSYYRLVLRLRALLRRIHELFHVLHAHTTPVV
eukprot:6212500-Pleurochrysis_carterae.AAC.6